MGSISTAQCSDVTFAKFLAPSTPAVEQPIPSHCQRSGVEVTQASSSRTSSSPRPRRRSASHPSVSAPFREVGSSSQARTQNAATEPSRDEAMAHSAATKVASRDSLEVLWGQIASSMDAYCARLVGRGHSLEEEDVVAASRALVARDCSNLLRHLQCLWERESGNAPELHAEACRIRDAEERHIVLCQLEDAIRRADVDDMELWLDEALQLGLDVEVEHRYCKSMRAALRDLCQDNAGSAWDTGGTTVWSSGGVEMDAFPSAAAEFDTWNSAFSDPLFFPDASEMWGGTGDSPTRVTDDSAGERTFLWVQLEEALKSKDLDAAFEAIAMLESVGELDADTAAEARALAEEEQRTQLPRQSSTSSPSAARRRHSAPDLHYQNWDAPPTSFGTSSSSTAPRPQPNDARSAAQNMNDASRNRPRASAGRDRNGAGWTAHMAAVHANMGATKRETENWSAWAAPSGLPKANVSPKASHAPQMRQTPSETPKAAAKAPATTPSPSSQPAPSGSSLGIRGRLFKEALWKRKINMQTMNRMRSGSQASSSTPVSPRPTREQARSAYATSVRNAVNAERPSDSNVGTDSSGRQRQAPSGAPPSHSSWSQPYPKMRAGVVGEDAPERHPSKPIPEFVPSKSPWSFFNREARQTETPKEAPRQQQQSKPTQAKPQPAPPPPPPPKSSAPPKPAPHKAAHNSAAPPAPKSAASGSSKSAPEPKPKPKATPSPPPHASPGGLSPMELLELKPGFSDDDLRAAYKRAAMRWHPDRPAWRAAGEAEVQHATDMFQKCKDAYDILSGKGGRVAR